MELSDVGVHPAGGRRPEGARRHARRCLGRSGVVDRVVAEVGRHLLTRVEPLLDLRVGDVARHDQWTAQREPRLHRVPGELGEDRVHRLVEVDPDDLPGSDLVGDAGTRHVARRVGLELLEEDPVGGDLGEGLPVGGAGDGDRDGTGRAVAGEADDPDVVAEVLPAELRADAERLGQLEDLLLELEVAEAVGTHRAGCRQVVEVVRGGILGGLQRILRARPADDDGKVVGRARGRSERADLLVEVGQQPAGVEDRLRLLEEERLVGRASALGHEEELVFGGTVLVRRRVDLDLGREVGAGVLLLEHRQRRELGVAQVERGVGVLDARADRLGVVDAGEHALGLLAHHDRGAGVLAHRQYAAGGDVEVLEQVEGDEAVVARRLGVIDDAAQLGEVGRSQVVADVVNRLGREPPDRFGVDAQEHLAVGLERADALGGHQAVRRRVGAVRTVAGEDV